MRGWIMNLPSTMLDSNPWPAPVIGYPECLPLNPFHVLLTAIATARLRQPRAIWRQQVDDRGRPLGDPLRLPDRTRL
jgi:hypothetical protein